MVNKKDILDVVAWSGISTIMGVSTSLLMSLYTGNERQLELLKVAWRIIGGSISGGIIGGRHVASMKDKYNEQDLEIIMAASVASTCAISGVLTGCGLLPELYNALNTANNMTAQNNNPYIWGEVFIECCGISMSAAVMSMILTLGIFNHGLEMKPLRFPTFDEKASLKLKEVLSYDDNLDKDIFETLERYNKVYKKMFVTLGTPYEMAKITKNEDIAKKIGEKNHQLVLQALLASKFARDNTMSILP